MKKLITMTAILVAFVLITAAYARDFEVQKKAGDYNVSLKFDKSVPSTGDNNVEVIIKDTAGADVTDAKVVVGYSMAAMPGMPAMNYKADASLKGTSYRAKVNLSMSGSWAFDVKITHGGSPISAKFNIDAK